MQTFEKYLQNIFMKLEPQVLDDDLPEAFDTWLENRDVNEIVEHAEKWGAGLLTKEN